MYPSPGTSSLYGQGWHQTLDPSASRAFYSKPGFMRHWGSNSGLLNTKQALLNCIPSLKLIPLDDSRSFRLGLPPGLQCQEALSLCCYLFAPEFTGSAEANAPTKSFSIKYPFH